LERRGVYRGIEEVAESGRFEDGEYPHSGLSRKLRYDYRENKDFRSLLIGQMIAVSATASHEKVDINSGIKARKDLLKEAFSTIPYMSDKKEDTTDRDRAVELFNEVAEEMEKLSEKLMGSSKTKVDIESE
jgi:hypothetical protein